MGSHPLPSQCLRSSFPLTTITTFANTNMNATETANNLGKVNLPLNAQINREEGSSHGAMPGTKKMPDLELILKVVMPSDPTFHFRNYVYIRLIVTKLGILKGVTSHSHMITNIHCKCSFNMYLAHYSTDLLCSTCKTTLKK